MSNLISGKKIYGFGGNSKGIVMEDMPLAYRIDFLIEDILKYPAVSIKGMRDDLIIMNLEKDPPVFDWVETQLRNIDEPQLMILRTLVEKRFEAGIK